MINQTLWIGTSAAVVLLVVRAINTDGMASVLTSLRGGKPTSVPPLLLPWLALFFGGLSAALNALVNGSDVQAAIAGGIVSAATAAFGSSLGKSIPGVRRAMYGRSTRLGSVLLLVGAMLFGGASAGCPSGASSPTVDAEAGAAFVDAAGPAVNGVCDLIEVIDSSNTVKSICATVEEVIQAVGFILTLRESDPDAGRARADAGECVVLPRSSLCATNAERAKAIVFLVNHRAARYKRDGGTSR